MNNTHGLEPKNEIFEVIKNYKSVFWAIASFSGLINLLLLTPAIYMMQMYDRVLGSRSEVTLVMLSLIALFLYLLMGLLEFSRSKITIKMSNLIDEKLSTRVFSAAYERNLSGQQEKAGTALNDLLVLRQFITGPSLFAFFDLPWAPIFVMVIWLFHPLLGMLAIFGTGLMILLTYLSDKYTHDHLTESQQLQAQASYLATTHFKNSEIIEALGMFDLIKRKWGKYQSQFLEKQSEASESGAIFSALTKSARYAIQSAVLGVGAYLVIDGDASPGIMIAASVLTGRAMSPVDGVLGAWKNFTNAKDSYERLNLLLSDTPERKERIKLPPPQGNLRIDNIVATPPGSYYPALRNISMTCLTGEIVAIIGPSASGKSTLSRIIVGAWQSNSGKVTIDGYDINHWNKSELGPYIGYLPQDIELFNGTVAENICRFGELDSAQIILASKKAGIHEMIQSFPNGYETKIGIDGSFLSGGQRQRVALARALYGNPHLIVLDEPNSNLDEAGETALGQALLTAKGEGKIVILVSHRPDILKIADKLCLMGIGKIMAYGGKDEITALIKNELAKKRQSKTDN